jgi:xylulokinase
MKSSDKYILAIDLGTSGPKVLLVTAGGEVVACERDETPLYLMPGGGAEQDPQEWWQAICRATRRLLEQLSFPAESIAAIGCTTQWAGTVAVDREGRSLMRALIWLDSRGAPYVRRITGGLLEVGGYNPARLWAWLRLTGRFLSACHTIALHWLTDNRRIDRVCYASKLLDMTGIDVQKLPDLKQGTEIIGPLTTKAAADLGLPETVQVVMGAPDIHASAIGAGAVRDYQSNLYIGTSSWLTCHVPFKKTDVLHSIGTLPSACPVDTW